MTDCTARSITRRASTQTYYTILFLADPDRVEQAYRAYAYFRWVDDVLDADSGSTSDRRSFLERQKGLLRACSLGEPLRAASSEERILEELIHPDDRESGLHAYVGNLMRVMTFDSERRGRLITQAELTAYTRWLAAGVTECMYYCIGHDDRAPRNEKRNLAVAGAHIAHMLRDTYDDIRAGYYNIPREFLEAYGIGPEDVESDPYRAWVHERAALAREYLRAGRENLQNIACRRHRLAVIAYSARFEWFLDVLERDAFRLRTSYHQRRSFATAIRMARLSFAAVADLHRAEMQGQRGLSHTMGRS